MTIIRRLWLRYVLVGTYQEGHCQGGVLMVPRIFYIHIPKCAGTTLHHIIEQQYEPEEIYTVPAVDWQEDCYNDLRDKWPAEKKKRIRVVKGHMLFGWNTAFLPDPSTYITFLRHPVERITSLYNFSRSSKGHYLHDRAMRMKLHEFARLGDVPELSNYMTRSIAGIMPNKPIVLEWALANIISHFSFVGIVEKFDAGVNELQNLFGWRHVDYEPLNVTPKPKHRTIDDEKAWQAIIQNNRMDYKLYNLVSWGIVKREQIREHCSSHSL